MTLGIDYPTVGVDLDGVMYDFDGIATYLLERHANIPVAKDSDEYSFHQLRYPDAWGWLLGEGAEKHGLYRHGNLIRGALDGLHDLLSITRVTFVTKRKETRRIRKDTVEWLAFHSLPSEVVFVNHGRSKLIAGCDIYIDDSPTVIEDLKKNRHPYVMYSHPWNDNVLVPEDSLAYNWCDVVELTKGKLGLPSA